jgi:hypothetical protein
MPLNYPSLFNCSPGTTAVVLPTDSYCHYQAIDLSSSILQLAPRTLLFLACSEAMEASWPCWCYGCWSYNSRTHVTLLPVAALEVLKMEPQRVRSASHILLTLLCCFGRSPTTRYVFPVSSNLVSSFMRLPKRPSEMHAHWTIRHTPSTLHLFCALHGVLNWIPDAGVSMYSMHRATSRASCSEHFRYIMETCLSVQPSWYDIGGATMYAGYAEAYPVKILDMLSISRISRIPNIIFLIGLRRNAVPCLNEKPSAT